MPDQNSIPSLHDLLRTRIPQVPVTKLLVMLNILAFLAMLVNGGGLWHSPNSVQLAWGANFGPATQDGEWWRLASAMFLHFGVLHLLMNMWALWDAGQLVERMYGHLRFAAIYLISGVVGNLLSLVSHQGHAVSGGASGAIFGVYGALLVALWRERDALHPEEFRWLFWGASGFALVTIVLGLMMPGIDNAAHCGGLLAGLLLGAALMPVTDAGKRLFRNQRLIAGLTLSLVLVLLIYHIPVQTYHWRNEVQAREEIKAFISSDARVSSDWQDILNESNRSGASFDTLAGRLDSTIGNHYEQSFEHLSRLQGDSSLPSAPTLRILSQYAEMRRDAARTMSEGLRRKDPKKIREALLLEKKSRVLQEK